MLVPVASGIKFRTDNINFWCLCFVGIVGWDTGISKAIDTGSRHEALDLLPQSFLGLIFWYSFVVHTRTMTIQYPGRVGTGTGYYGSMLFQ